MESDSRSALSGARCEPRKKLLVGDEHGINCQEQNHDEHHGVHVKADQCGGAIQAPLDAPDAAEGFRSAETCPGDRQQNPRGGMIGGEPGHRKRDRQATECQQVGAQQRWQPKIEQGDHGRTEN